MFVNALEINWLYFYHIYNILTAYETPTHEILCVLFNCYSDKTIEEKCKAMEEWYGHKGIYTVFTHVYFRNDRYNIGVFM